MIKVLPALAAHIISSGSGSLLPRTTFNQSSPHQTIEIAKGAKPTTKPLPANEPKQGCTINATVYGFTKEEAPKIALFDSKRSSSPSNGVNFRESFDYLGPVSRSKGKFNNENNSIDFKLALKEPQVHYLAIHRDQPGHPGHVVQRFTSYAIVNSCKNGENVNLELGRNQNEKL